MAALLQHVDKAMSRVESEHDADDEEEPAKVQMAVDGSFETISEDITEDIEEVDIFKDSGSPRVSFEAARYY